MKVNLQKIKSLIKIDGLTLEKVWLREVMLGFIIFLAVLYFDFYIYRNFVWQKRINVERPSIVSLRKQSIEAIAKKIKSNNDFITNPTFPVVQNPF